MNPTPAWTVENNAISSFLGSAVATAGDVNGDGYSDVLIGARGYTDIWGQQGGAYLYQGTAAGLAPAPSWTMDLVQDATGLGSAFGTAGDVNGDGFADVIIGAGGFSNDLSEEGAAFLFLGAASGLASSPSWTREGDGAFVGLGTSVGTAGDVNGDGYADLIIGAPMFTASENFLEGQASVYYGNGGAGLSLLPRQRQVSNLAPIAAGGRAQALEFRLTSQGRAPFGRGRARLEWELKPLWQVFDGNGLERSALSVDTGSGAGGALFSELIAALEPGAYHWRARFRYDSATTPLAQHSRWFTMPWGGWNETDLNLTGILGGTVWSDIDHDGLRDPGEPPVTGTFVTLWTAGGMSPGSATTWIDGSYRLVVRFPGAHRLEFQPVCYSMTTQDQGGDDFLDSDADPATRRTVLIGPVLTVADQTRWSAGLVGTPGQEAPTQAVVITGARPGNPLLAGVILDVQDPNPSGSVTGYNVYLSSSAALPAAQWVKIISDGGDEDPPTPGIQLSHDGAPPVGGAYFYQVTSAQTTCGVEGPRQIAGDRAGRLPNDIPAPLPFSDDLRTRYLRPPSNSP